MECLGETVKIDTIREGYALLSIEPEIARTFSGLWMMNINRIKIIYSAYLVIIM